MVSVRNMKGRTGKAIPNQFVITTDDATYFQSYNTVIAKLSQGQTVLSPSWDYSKTTGKYRNIFLQETRQETERKIKDGTYKIAELGKVLSR